MNASRFLLVILSLFVSGVCASGAVALEAGGGTDVCEDVEMSVPVYGGLASCYYDGERLEEYFPRSYTSLVTVRKVGDYSASCQDFLPYLYSETIESEECSYMPSLRVSVSPAYTSQGYWWVTVMATAGVQGDAEIEEFHWNVDNIESGGSSVLSNGDVRESRKVRLPSPLPDAISVNITVEDDEGRAVNVTGDLNVITRSGGR